MAEVVEELELGEISEVLTAPDENASLVPPAPPSGLDTALYEHDERAARSDLRRQNSLMEAELGQLFGSAFPRKGIEFGVAAPGGGPRILSVDELERVRDALASRLGDVKGRLESGKGIRGGGAQFLARIAAHCYYGDEQVMLALGYDAREVAARGLALRRAEGRV